MWRPVRGTGGVRGNDGLKQAGLNIKANSFASEIRTIHSEIISSTSNIMLFMHSGSSTGSSEFENTHYDPSI